MTCPVRVVALAAMLLALTGCVGEAWRSPGAIESQWADQGSFTPVVGWGDRDRMFEGEGTLWLRIERPQGLPPDSAVHTVIRDGLVEIRSGERVLFDGSQRFPVFPLPPGEAPVLVRYRSVVGLVRTAPVHFGSVQGLTERVIATDLPQTTVGVLMVLLGVGIMIAGIWPRLRREYLMLAALSAGLGLVFTYQADAFRLFLLPYPGAWRWIYALANVTYVAGSLPLVEVFFAGGRDRFLRPLLLVTLVLYALALAARILGVLPLSYALKIPIVATLVAVPRIVWLAGRAARRGEQNARLLLWAFGLMVLFGVPDTLWALGRQVLPFNTSHYGGFIFVAVLGMMLQTHEREQEEAIAQTSETLAARVKELETRNREVDALNEELRRQVAQRSKELAELLRGPTLRPARFHAGDLVEGRYRVMRLLGEGGMGAVFEAERKGDAKRVALKVMSGSVAPDDAARFVREAEIAAELDHENLVRVLDVGLSSGTPFLVMELLEGGSIEGQRARFGEPSWALPLLGQIAAGLSALHARGIVHRDLKPANVLLAPHDEGRSQALISDFGISRRSEIEDVEALDSTARARLTASGAIIGTPLYMAPETARGAARVGPPADVFAFGIMAHEMLTGALPFVLPPIFEEAAKLAPAPLAKLEGNAVTLPAGVAKLLDACIDRDPERRPQARALADALGRLPGS